VHIVSLEKRFPLLFPLRRYILYLITPFISRRFIMVTIFAIDTGKSVDYLTAQPRKRQDWKRKQLYLKKLREEQNEELRREICRRCDYSRYEVKNRFLVYFKVEKVLPLIGDGETI